MVRQGLRRGVRAGKPARTPRRTGWPPPFYFYRRTDAARRLAESEPAQVSPDAQTRFGAEGSFGDPDRTRAGLRRLPAPCCCSVATPTRPHPRLLHEFAALFPDASVVIQPQAGHVPWIDNPDRFIGAVTAFLDT